MAQSRDLFRLRILRPIAFRSAKIWDARVCRNSCPAKDRYSLRRPDDLPRKFDQFLTRIRQITHNCKFGLIMCSGAHIGACQLINSY